MKSWEFLIQKHGTNAWFPLKKHKLKLPEGKYRIAAKCDRPNLDVEVRVTHTIEETPPQHRSQQRQGRTNPEGLMVIVPFVNFTPGLWEIRASSDIMSELMGQPWQEVVQLRVSAQNSENLVANTPLPTTAMTDTESSSEVTVDEIAPQVESEIDAIAPESELEPEIDAIAPQSELESEIDEIAPQVESEIDAIAPESELEAEIDAIAPQPQLEPETLAEPFTTTETDSTPETKIQEQTEAQPHTLTNQNEWDTEFDLEAAEIGEIAPETAKNETQDEIDLKSLLDRSIQSLEEILQQANQHPNLEESEDLEETEPAPPPTPQKSWLQQIDERIGNLKLQLSLYHDNYVRHGLESLFLSGQVDAPTTSSNDLNILLAPLSDHNTVLLLRYHLRDPQSTAFYDPNTSLENTQSQYLYDNQQAETEGTLPLVFGFNLAVTSEFQQPLILGEAILELQVTNPSEAQPYTRILARQPFTIAAALDELLETAFPQEPQPSEPSPTVASMPLRTDFVDLTKTTSSIPVSQFHPKAKQPLPPKISPAHGEKNKRVLDLPPFNPPLPTSPLETQTSAEILFQTPPIASNLPLAPEPETPESETPKVAANSAIEDTTATSSPDITPSETAVAKVWDEPFADETNATLHADIELESPVSPETQPPENPEADLAFRSLHLQERFWDRMNSLAEDATFFSTQWPVEETFSTPIEDRGASPEQPELDVEAEPEAATADSEDSEASVIIPTTPQVKLPFEELLAPPPHLAWTSAPQPTEPLWEEGEESVAAVSPEAASDSVAESIEFDWDDDAEDDEESELDAALAVDPHRELVADTAPEEGQANEQQTPRSFFPTNPSQTVESEPPSSPEIADDAIADELLFAEDNSSPNATTANAEWYNPEIVLDDDQDWFTPPPPPRDTSGLPYPDTVRVSAQEALGGLTREDNTPIPVPILTVTEGELIAGEPVLVRVKLPIQKSAIYVKLWVIDCQTRHLLDGPRALVDFTALPTGELETMTQLQVPLGTMEIRFEAIAIDIATQRESRKTTVDRRAIPPDLPDFSTGLF
jgi:hypothetical protein